MSADDAEASDLGERITAYLRRRYPARTSENVAFDTGGKEATIAKMLLRRSTPSAALLLRLVQAYGCAFLVEVMKDPPAWLCEANRAAAQAELEQQLAAIQSRMERL